MQLYLKMEAFFQEALRTKIIHKKYCEDLFHGVKLCPHSGVVLLQGSSVVLVGVDLVLQGAKANQHLLALLISFLGLPHVFSKITEKENQDDRERSYAAMFDSPQPCQSLLMSADRNICKN